MKTLKSVLEAKASERLQQELKEQKARGSKQTAAEEEEAIKANSQGRLNTGDDI